MGIEELIDRYCEAWSVRDRATRTAIVKEVWSEDGVYSDPNSNVKGVQGLDDLIDVVAAQFPPGVSIKRTSAVDTHHGVARFAWVLESEGVSIEGIDIAFLGDDGRKLDRVIGFFGPLRPRA